MNVLQVIAYSDGIEIGRCNYTFLNPLAYSSTREFTFKDFQVSAPCSIGNSGHSYINVSIYTVKAYGVTVQLNKFKLVPLQEADFTVSGDITVYGTIVPDWFTDVYNQALIDAFYEWENNQLTESNYPSHIIKSERLSAKGIYSGLPKSLNDGDIFIEAEMITDCYDFYNVLATALVGKKGYIGVCYNSLHDSLIESYDKERDIHLIFKNSDKLHNIFPEGEFLDIVELLRSYNLKVTFQS